MGQTRGLGGRDPRNTCFQEILRLPKTKYLFGILQFSEHVLKHIMKTLEVMFQVVFEGREYYNHIRHAFVVRIDRLKHDFR